MLELQREDSKARNEALSAERVALVEHRRKQEELLRQVADSTVKFHSDLMGFLRESNN